MRLGKVWGMGLAAFACLHAGVSPFGAPFAWAEAGAVSTVGSGSVNDDFWDTYLDGETVRYLVGDLGPDSKLRPLLDELEGVRIYREGDRLMLNVRWTHEFILELKPESEAASKSLYAIEVPQVARFALKMKDGVLTLKQLDTEGAGLKLQANLPWLPDTIWFHGARVDLVSGEIQAEAGVIGNIIAVVAKLQLKASEIAFGGISLFEHIADDIVFDQAVVKGSSTDPLR